MSRVKEAIEKAKASQQARKKEAPSMRPVHVEQGLASPAGNFGFDDQELLTPEDLSNRFIIHPNMADRSIEESIMAIRAAVLLRSAGKGCSVLVTATSSRGKNRFVALNLAVAFASDVQISAILVNSNFRLSPNAYSDLTENTYGLSDYLAGSDRDVDKLLLPIGIERLCLINTGTNVGQQQTFLTASRFKRVFGALRDRHPVSYVIFDAPPILESSDTRVLANECDLVIVVAEYGESSEQDLKETLDLVGKDKLLGVVLNNEPKWPAAIS